MKKILLLNNLDQINHLKKIKNKFHKIIVFDYRSAIICNQKKIDFTYINDVNRKIGPYNNLLNLLKSSYSLSKKIDKNIYLVNKNLIGNNFFSNYHKFSLCKIYLEKYYDDIKFLIKKYPQSKFFYFKNNSTNFDFLLECIEAFKLKCNKKFVKINSLNLKPKFNNLYPNLYDDIKISPIRNIFKNLINFNNSKGKKILIYLLEKDYIENMKQFSKSHNLSLFFYSRQFLNKKYFDEKSFNKKFKIKIFRDKIKNSFYKKLIIFLSPYIINEVLAAKENISSILKKKSVDLYCTSHPTLISATVREYLNQRNIKTLTCLHGGTVGHFEKGFFWPDLSHNNIKNKQISFIHSYSKEHLNEILKDQKKNNSSSIKNKYVSFKHETFFKLKKIKKFKNIKFNIGYITQSNSNVLIGLNKNYNDPFKLYKFRTDLVEKIIKKDSKFKLLISNTEDDVNYLFNNNLFKMVNDLKKVQIYRLNAIEVMKRSNIIILEQPSSTLIESLFLNVSNIIVLKNPLWKIKRSQKIILNKRVNFADNFDDIMKLINNVYRKNIKNNDFLKKYYYSKEKYEFRDFLNQLLN